MKRFLPALVTMGLIFFLSQQPGDSFSIDLPNNSDKLAHAAIYGLLAACSLFAISPPGKKIPWLYKAAIIIFCFIYGIMDEWHQSFVPLRTPSFFDLLADGVGAAIAVVSYSLFQRYRADERTNNRTDE